MIVFVIYECNNIECCSLFFITNFFHFVFYCCFSVNASGECTYEMMINQDDDNDDDDDHDHVNKNNAK